MDLKLSKHFLFEYNPDTLQYLRKLYNLDKPERLDESIEILVKWLQKQDHLIKKDYSKDFFERSLLSSKGSVERIKTKLDKVATFKTLLPNFYEPFDIRNSKILQNIFCSFVPKMTKDHDRIYVVKIFGNEYSSLFDIYKYNIMICELLQALDYSNSIINVFDARDCNIVALVKAINFVHFQQCVSIVMEGYKLRIKEFHFITPSKAIDTLVTIFKQVLTPKLAQRIHVHKNVDTLYEYVPKKICPKDLGGDEKSIKELNDNLMDVLTSEEFTKYFNESISAKTNEDYRRVDKFNEQCMDMPGSFRRLTLD